jgi:PAS domain S-box-containing protein
MNEPTLALALQRLIDGMLEAVWMVDPVGLRVLAANHAAHVLLGETDGALVGRPVIELAATPEDMVFWEDVAAGLSDRILSDSMVRRTDGSLVQVERRVSLLRLDPGHSVFLVCLRDRTEQRRAEDELERLVS